MRRKGRNAALGRFGAQQCSATNKRQSKASIKPNTSKASISAATARNWLLFGIAAGPTPYLVVVLIPTFL
jgi:hypothetical protein